MNNVKRSVIFDRAKAIGASDKDAVWLATYLWIDVPTHVDLADHEIDRILKAALWHRDNRILPLDSLPHPR